MKRHLLKRSISLRSECFERKVTLLGLFDRINNAVFLKEDSEAEKQLRALQELEASLSGDVLSKFEQEISKVEAGIVGEKQHHQMIGSI